MHECEFSLQPLIVLITGASGVGKTTLLKEIEQQYPQETISSHFFDSIGVPSFDDMIQQYGSTEKWQEITTRRWIERLSQIHDKKLIFLEGQFNPEFALTPLKEHGIKNYLLICLHTEQAIREHRLSVLRNQPELADIHMNNWALFLKEKTIEMGGVILDSSQDSINMLVMELMELVRKKLQLEIECKEISFSYPGLSHLLEPSVGCPTPEKMEQVLLSYTQSGQHLVGAFLKNDLVGVIGLHLEESFAIIRHIAVIEVYRNQGIGKNMLMYVLNHFLIQTLRAETDDEAYGFYQQCGFRCEAFINKHGKRYTCYLDKQS
ncbi:TPA: GNAT family N-acetyltransferase [Legionella pneumophila]|nr:GNAT family N-acetyltransferase [Legionella pneumophila]